MFSDSLLPFFFMQQKICPFTVIGRNRNFNIIIQTPAAVGYFASTFDCPAS